MVNIYKILVRKVSEWCEKGKGNKMRGRAYEHLHNVREEMLYTCGLCGNV